MKIEERNEGSALVVSPAGRLDGVGAPVLEARVSAVVGRGVSLVVLDCGRIVYISRAGLRTLLVSAKTCQREGVEVVVAGLRPECLSVVNASGLLLVVDCQETVEAALRQGRLADAGKESTVAAVDGKNPRDPFPESVSGSNPWGGWETETGNTDRPSTETDKRMRSPRRSRPNP